MKKVVAGAGAMITGAILSLCAYVAAGMAISNPLLGWDSDKGVFWSYMGELKLVPTLAVGILLIIAGALLMAWGVFAKSEK